MLIIIIFIVIIVIILIVIIIIILIVIVIIIIVFIVIDMIIKGGLVDLVWDGNLKRQEVCVITMIMIIISLSSR